MEYIYRLYTLQLNIEDNIFNISLFVEAPPVIII